MTGDGHLAARTLQILSIKVRVLSTIHPCPFVSATFPISTEPEWSASIQIEQLELTGPQQLSSIIDCTNTLTTDWNFIENQFDEVSRSRNAAERAPIGSSVFARLSDQRKQRIGRTTPHCPKKTNTFLPSGPPLHYDKPSFSLYDLIASPSRPTMPPLLKTYFNPSHRSFLQTLFTATFLGSVLIVAFPCPVRPTEGGFHKVVNQDESSSRTDSSTAAADAASTSTSTSTLNTQTAGQPRGKKVDVVVMLNERGRTRGRPLFMEED